MHATAPFERKNGATADHGIQSADDTKPKDPAQLGDQARRPLVRRVRHEQSYNIALPWEGPKDTVRAIAAWRERAGRSRYSGSLCT